MFAWNSIVPNVKQMFLTFNFSAIRVSSENTTKLLYFEANAVSCKWKPYSYCILKVFRWKGRHTDRNRCLTTATNSSLLPSHCLLCQRTSRSTRNAILFVLSTWDSCILRFTADRTLSFSLGQLPLPRETYVRSQDSTPHGPRFVVHTFPQSHGNFRYAYCLIESIFSCFSSPFLSSFLFFQVPTSSSEVFSPSWSIRNCGYSKNRLLWHAVGLSSIFFCPEQLATVLITTSTRNTKTGICYFGLGKSVCICKYVIQNGLFQRIDPGRP